MPCAFLKSLSVTLFLFITFGSLPACFFNFKSSQNENSSSTSDEELASDPVPVSGKNLITATFDNSRARCSFASKQGNEYEISCIVTAVDTTGSEVRADLVEDGLSLQWMEPKVLEGASIIRHLSSCSMDKSGLSQNCRIHLAEGPSSRVEFGLEIFSRNVQRTRMESSVLLLPFAVESFGLVSHIPLSLFTPMSFEKSASRAEGFQTLLLNPTDTLLASASSLCEMDGVLYIAVPGFIYSLDASGLRLFAGSNNPGNANELSYRLRTYFGVGLGTYTGDGPYDLSIACHKGSVYVSNYRFLRVLQIHPSGVVSMIAGTTGQPGYEGDNGPAKAAKLKGPRGIAVTHEGVIYLNDSGANVIRKIDTEGVISRVAGLPLVSRGLGDPNGDLGPALSAALRFPNAIALGNQGDLYISEGYIVRRVDASGVISTVAGSGVLNGAVVDDIPAVEASLHKVVDMRVSSLGHLHLLLESGCVRRVNSEGKIRTVIGNCDYLSAFKYSRALELSGKGTYISDAEDAVIRRVDSSGVITAVAGKLRAGSRPDFSGDGGPAVQAKFGPLRGLTLDQKGNIYLSDSHHHRIRMVDSSGIVKTIAGDGQGGFSGDGGPALQARLNFPNGLAVAPDGSLYLADTLNKRVRKIDPNGIITTVAGGGTGPDLGDEGSATAAMLGSVEGIAVDSKGVLYIADFTMGRIRYVDSQQVIHTLAGGGDQTVDGVPALDARVTQPRGVAVAADGTVFISELAQDRVRKIDVGTPRRIHFVTGIATGFGQNGGDGGNALTGRLYRPMAVAVGPDGSVFIADKDNSRVRQLTPNSGGYIISTWAGGTSPIDCGSGVITGKALASELEAELESSLSAICISSPVQVAVAHNCEHPKGQLQVAFTQTFVDNTSNATGHIVRVTRPCPR